MSDNRCCLCGRQRRKHGVTLFSWPDQKRDDWARVLQLAPKWVVAIQNRRLCHHHFHMDDVHTTREKKMLYESAVPFDDGERVDGVLPATN